MDEALQALLDKLAATAPATLKVHHIGLAQYQASFQTTSDAASGRVAANLADALTSLLETVEAGENR